jgi:hypothetical protein
MSYHHGIIAPLFCLLLLAGEYAFAGRLFEWVDSTGTTHFSDRPPPGLPFTEKTITPASGPEASGAETGLRKAERDRLENAQRKDSETAQARQAAALAIEQKKSRCRKARTRYQEASHRRGAARNGDFKIFWRKMKQACD